MLTATSFAVSFALLRFNGLLYAFPKRCDGVNAKKEVDVIRAERAFVEPELNDGKKRFPSPKPEISDVKEKSHWCEVVQTTFIKSSSSPSEM
jgi:hypothetical protein